MLFEQAARFGNNGCLLASFGLVASDTEHPAIVNVIAAIIVILNNVIIFWPVPRSD